VRQQPISLMKDRPQRTPRYSSRGILAKSAHSRVVPGRSLTFRPRAMPSIRDRADAWNDESMRIVVLSDTHAPRFWKRCPPGVAEHLSAAEVILHAGDVCVASVLEELSAYAPVHAVLGNNDGKDVDAWGATETAELDLAGLRVGMIHDAGPREGRLARLRRRFPDIDLVVFGHSHIPLQAVDGNFRIFNPGSPTDKRRQPHRTLGVLEIEYGHLSRAEIVTLP
jgi:uncharacterized protein